MQVEPKEEETDTHKALLVYTGSVRVRSVTTKWNLLPNFSRSWQQLVTN